VLCLISGGHVHNNNAGGMSLLLQGVLAYVMVNQS
jgi:hypothetical protein